jgi:hypothetical protein
MFELSSSCYLPVNFAKIQIYDTSIEWHNIRSEFIFTASSYSERRHTDVTIYLLKQHGNQAKILTVILFLNYTFMFTILLLCVYRPI